MNFHSASFLQSTGNMPVSFLYINVINTPNVTIYLSFVYNLLNPNFLYVSILESFKCENSTDMVMLQ